VPIKWPGTAEEKANSAHKINNDFIFYFSEIVNLKNIPLNW
jgi:hypothetical protein